MTLFYRKINQHPDWYREHNPAGTDLEDVTSESNNTALGIIQMEIHAPNELSFRVCTVSITLVGATVHVGVFQSKRENGIHYLAVPDQVELPKKIHAQALRYVEAYIAEKFGA